MSKGPRTVQISVEEKCDYLECKNAGKILDLNTGNHILPEADIKI